MDFTRGTNRPGTRRLVIFLGSLGIALAVALGGPTGVSLAAPLADTTPDLGTANPFAVLAGTTITDAGATSVIDGNVGLDPAGGASIADLTCNEMVAGSRIYDNNGGYTGNGGSSGIACLTTDAGLVLGAKNDLITAYDRLAATDNTACDRDIAAVDNLSLLSPLGPGVYCADAFIIPTNLVLSGSATDIWIFRSRSTIDTDPGVTVSGPASCSIWWRAETSVTIGTGNVFIGNVLALASISDDGGSTINGRLLARNGAVTLNNTTINRGPLCAPFSETVPPEEVTGLPDTGGAPIRNEGFPWSLVIVGGFSAIALAVGVRAYRRAQLPRQ